MNQKYKTSEAFVSFPNEALGTEHIIASWESKPLSSEMAIVGVYNDTIVTITPSASVTNGSSTINAGTPFSFTLDNLQTIQFLSPSGDLTGTIVSSTKPIVVYGGNECANVPASHCCCNHLVEQMPPINTWGNKFITVPLAFRKAGDFIRVISGADNNTLIVDGVLINTLNKGEFYTFSSTKACVITTSGPSMTVQYSKSFAIDNTMYILLSETN